MAQSLTLQTSDSDIVVSDVLGRLSFAASSEASGSDALLIGAGIYAEAESSFTAISNATSLIFATASSESATGKLKITSGGHLLPLLNNAYDIGSSSFIFRNLYLNSGIFTNNVGIGTGAPNARLHVVSAASQTAALISGPAGGGIYVDFAGAGTNYYDGNHVWRTASGARTTATLDNRFIAVGNSEAYAFGVRHSAAGGVVYFGAKSSSASPDAQISNAGGGALMVLQNGGNVGIGSPDDPTCRLDLSAVSNIANSNWAGGTNFIRLLAGVGSAFSEPAIAFQETTTNVGAKIGVKNKGNGAYDIIFANRDNSSLTSPLTERMRILANGNVGIGTSSPAQKLDITGGSLSINTNGQSSIFSTRYGANSVGNNIWVGNGGSVAIGDAAATYMGSYNSSFGINSLFYNTTGFQNCAFGNSSLINNTTGYYNSAFGQASLQTNIVGLGNCGFGLNALLSSTSNTNSAFGFVSMQSTTTGADNCAFGATSLFANTTGSNNCAFGRDAGRYINSGAVNQTSSTSIYIGNDSRASANGNTNEIVIGSTSRGNGSNTVTIGNSSITNNVFNGTITSKKVAIIDNINTPSSYADGLQVEIRATSGVAGLSLNRSGNSYVGIHTDSLNRLKFNMNGGTPFLNHNIGSILGLGVVGHAMFGFESGTFFLDYTAGIISSVSRVSTGVYEITTIDADFITFVASSTVINCTTDPLFNRVRTFTAAGAAVDSRYVTVIAIKQI
jgi:hypothetical protein